LYPILIFLYQTQYFCIWYQLFVLSITNHCTVVTHISIQCSFYCTQHTNHYIYPLHPIQSSCILSVNTYHMYPHAYMFGSSSFRWLYPLLPPFCSCQCTHHPTLATAMNPSKQHNNQSSMPQPPTRADDETAQASNSAPIMTKVTKHYFSNSWLSHN
jgi:hypothetical protein